MATINSYANLQTEILAWLARSTDTNLSGEAPNFIAFFEYMMAYGHDDAQFHFDPLRIRGMETAVQIVISTPLSGNTVSGTQSAILLTPQTAISSNTNGLLYQFSPTSNCAGATTLQVSTAPAANLVKGSARSTLAVDDFISGGTYNAYYDGLTGVWVLLPELSHAPLPVNYLAMRSFYSIGSPDNLPLDYIAPSLLNTIYMSNEVNRPRKFTIEGDALRFGPIPDTTYFAPCIYYQQFTPLSNGVTNWMLTNRPDIYLWGSLWAACVYRQDDESAARYFRFLQGAVSALSRQDQDDRHSGSALAIQNDTGNP